MTEPVASTRRSLQPRERAMLIVLGIIAALAVAFLLLNALGGGGEEETVTPRRPPIRTSPAPTATETPPPETDEAFEGKDPFQPLVIPAAADAPADGEQPPEDTGGPADGGDANGDGVSDGESRRVTLLDVFEDDGDLMATVEVGGNQYTVAEGETFAENFRLLDLTDECGQFVFGDERFTLCIGQEVRK